MKTPREILLDQHRAVTPRLDRLREKVLKSELSPAMDAPAARKKNSILPAPNFWSTLFSPLRTPGFAVMLIAAAAAFAAGWKFHSSGGEPAGSVIAHTASGKTIQAPQGKSVADASQTFLQILAEPDGFLQTVHLNDFVAMLDEAQVRGLLETVLKHPHPGVDDDWGHAVLLARWTQLDPAAALAWAQGRNPAEREGAMLAVIVSWNGHDPAPLFAAVAHNPDSDQRRDLESSLIDTLAIHNPQAAFKYFASLSADQREDEYDDVFKHWAQTDSAAALAAAESLPAGQERDSALESLASGWSQTDPAAALSWAQSLPSNEARNDIMPDIMKNLAAQDPQAALKTLDDLPNNNLRTELLNDVASAWSETDPAAALDWAQSLPSGEARNSAMSNIIDNLGQQDPQAALKMLDDLPNNNLRTNLVNEVANNWSQTDPAAALNWVQGADLPVAIQQNVIPNILRQLGEADPQAAVAYVAQIPAGPVRQNAISTIADVLAEADPAAALSWAANITDMNPTTQSNVMNNILNTWAGNDPAATAAYVQAHWSDPGVSNVANNVASQWAQSDPTAALAWANAMPDSPVKTAAINTALLQQANEDPAAVWNYLQQLPADDTSFQDVAQSVIINWGQQDPAEAAKVVASLPEGDASRQAYSTLANSWLNEDPLAASQWIATLPDSANRDSAVAQLVSSQSMYEPDTAFAWALTIDDDTLRQNNLRTAARELYRSNPAAAQQAITAALPGDQAAAVLQQAQTDIERNTAQLGQLYPGGPIMLDRSFPLGNAGPRPMMTMAATTTFNGAVASGFNGATASGAADDGSFTDASAVGDGPPNPTDHAPPPSGSAPMGATPVATLTPAMPSLPPPLPSPADAPGMVVAPAPMTASPVPMLPPDSVGGAKIGPGPSALSVAPTGPMRLGKPMIVPPPSKTKTPAITPTSVTSTSAVSVSSNMTNTTNGTNAANGTPTAPTMPAVAPATGGSAPVPTAAVTSSNTTATPPTAPAASPAPLPPLVQ